MKSSENKTKNRIMIILIGLIASVMGYHVAEKIAKNPSISISDIIYESQGGRLEHNKNRYLFGAFTGLSGGLFHSVLSTLEGILEGMFHLLPDFVQPNLFTKEFNWDDVKTGNWVKLKPLSKCKPIPYGSKRHVISIPGYMHGFGQYVQIVPGLHYGLPDRFTARLVDQWVYFYSWIDTSYPVIEKYVNEETKPEITLVNSGDMIVLTKFVGPPCTGVPSGSIGRVIAAGLESEREDFIKAAFTFKDHEKQIPSKVLRCAKTDCIVLKKDSSEYIKALGKFDVAERYAFTSDRSLIQ